MNIEAQALKLYEFSRDGVAYLRSYLARNAEVGGRLGRLLMQRQLEDGSTWAFLPPGSRERASASFETGGFAPTGDVQPMGDGILVYIRLDALDARVIAWAADELAGGDSIVFVEDAMNRRHDFPGPASGFAVPTVFCSDHVYRYSRSRRDLAPVIRGARGALWNPHVGVITACPASLRASPEMGAEMSSEALLTMAREARAIIVGAWDSEAFLIWEPRGG